MVLTYQQPPPGKGKVSEFFYFAKLNNKKSVAKIQLIKVHFSSPSLSRLLTFLRVWLCWTYFLFDTFMKVISDIKRLIAHERAKPSKNKHLHKAYNQQLVHLFNHLP